MTPPLLKIRLYGDPCLRKKSDPVREVGPGERMLIQSMIRTMYHEKGVGLAAPQVGINKQILVADIGEGPVVVINPKITSQAGAAGQEEGCLSIPEVTVVVNRPEQIIVRYLDEDNKVQEKVFRDLMARVIQHETDHLNGKLIIDYASAQELKKYQAKLDALKDQ